jgi:hypothetical protein
MLSIVFVLLLVLQAFFAPMLNKSYTVVFVITPCKPDCVYYPAPDVVFSFRYRARKAFSVCLLHLAAKSFTLASISADNAISAPTFVVGLPKTIFCLFR